MQKKKKEKKDAYRLDKRRVFNNEIVQCIHVVLLEKYIDIEFRSRIRSFLFTNISQMDYFVVGIRVNDKNYYS